MEAQVTLPKQRINHEALIYAKVGSWLGIAFIVVMLVRGILSGGLKDIASWSFGTFGIR